jgi:type II secretory pathway component PulK
MKKLIAILLILTISFAAYAQEKKVNLRKLSPQQRREHLVKQENEWKKKTKEQKLAFVETRRVERLLKKAADIRKEDAKWKSMSADEKIETYNDKLDDLESRIKKMDAKKKPGC